MDQAKEGSPSPIEDIPEARREQVESGRKLGGSRRTWLWLGGGLGAIALLSSGLLLASVRQSGLSEPESISGITPPEPAATATDPSTPDAAADPLGPTQKVLLGHRAYENAPAEDLIALTADGQIRLRRAAAEKFQDMAAAAAAEGVILVPLSGFRSQEDQERLFFEIKADRGESASTRAEVSAPPGYSEHHTGYALDIGDGRSPAADVEPEFEQTDAYRWLRQNAAYYGFEISFDRNNPQGVAYEPWHWRFVGDRDSLETFYQTDAAAAEERGAGPETADNE
ncbi:MAG: D-alanyl-D-alanine carboxypeptidase family protein [Cyanobacteria bacterium Co-bin13]|nr:D-alanyl-D-alanine carboxypeptidase family protein [Cyanobacteria bacterium Co-bin13]